MSRYETTSLVACDYRGNFQVVLGTNIRLMTSDQQAMNGNDESIIKYDIDINETILIIKVYVSLSLILGRINKSALRHHQGIT